MKKSYTEKDIKTLDPREVTVRGASARGIQMTTKSISRISSSHPAWWEDVASGKVAMF